MGNSWGLLAILRTNRYRNLQDGPIVHTVKRCFIYTSWNGITSSNRTICIIVFRV
jgi:hypothetical protein